MRKRLLLAAAALLALAIPPVGSSGADEPQDHAPHSEVQSAVFAGGCFWCVESAFEEVQGVSSAISGYTGGEKKNPSYEEVSAGLSGHLESVRLIFDSTKVSYRDLLVVFWHNVDPTDGDGQFCDHGKQYRSAIFYADETQKAAALASREEIEKTKPFKEAIVTDILPAKDFYPAEDYHQDYYKKNPIRYKFYRFNCGRDKRLNELWGKKR